MNELHLKPQDEGRRDLISLGEVLLRFDPGERRISDAREFRVYDGGGEYNVARNLAHAFGQKTAIVTALADNALGRLAENLIRAGGVEASEILWRAGEGGRNGLYFIERGFGSRAPASCFDRANTAIAALQPGEIDWQRIFGGARGARWFHTGGIFVGLSEEAPAVAAEAMRAARERGIVVSYDLNYRDSLWRARGGREAANRLNRELLPLADIAFGAFEFDSRLSNFDESDFRRAAAEMFADFPNLKAIASSLREVHSASRHDLSAVCAFGDQIFKAAEYKSIEVFDRVGSGDAFAAGFIYALLIGQNAQYAVDCGAAAAVLAMTTPGDNLAVTKTEIERLMQGAGAHAIR